MRRLLMIASFLTSACGGGGTPTSGSDGGTVNPADGGDTAAVDAGSSPFRWEDLAGVSMTAISSEILNVVPQGARAHHAGEILEDFYIAPSPSICTETWVDYGCDSAFPLYPAESNCAGALRIDYEDATSCPVCVDPPKSEPSCGEARRRYLQFLDHNLRETCTNWCESASDCVLWEVDACGLKLDFALRGLVDEEPLAFAESFDIDNCHVCDGEPSFDQSIEGALQVLCENHQCVIQPLATPSPEPASPDAGL